MDINNNEELSKFLSNLKKSTEHIGGVGDYVKAMKKMDLQKAKNILCESCNGNRFTPFFYLKQISELDSPNGRATVLPIQAYQCSACSHVNDIFVKQVLNKGEQ